LDVDIMKQAVSIWQRYWFPAVPVRRVAIYRIVVATFAFIDITVVSGYMSRYSGVSLQFYKPLRIIRIFGSALPFSPAVTTALHILLSVTLAMAIVGLFTRVALLIAAPLYLWWFATFYSFGNIQHGRIIVALSLFALLVAPAGRALSVDAIRLRARQARAGAPLPAPLNETDPLAGWSLRVIMILVVAAYTLAAYAKIHTSGLGWATSGALERVIVEKHTATGMWLSHYPVIVKSMQALTLFMEGTTAIVLLRGRIRDLYFLALAFFHIGTLVLLNINFLGLMVGYLAFYDLELGAARVAAVARRKTRIAAIAFTYDAGCGLCARAMSIVQSLDWLGRVTVTPAESDLIAVKATRRGQDFEGYAAFREAAKVVPLLWPALAVAYLRPVAALGERVYGWVARHRATSGACGVGTDSSCAGVLSAAQPPAEYAGDKESL
jgi:predicted DCC family thiol-disulfide oxidoreductase YuxK